MNTLHRIESWGEAHHPKWVDILRIALGIFLLYKGIDFLRNTGDIIGLMTGNREIFGSFKMIILAHVIVVVHIMGGILITLGLLTRLACLAQIPIVAGAVIFINLSKDIFQPYSELVISVIVLLLLIYFLIVGNGPWSFEKMAVEEKRRQN